MCINNNNCTAVYWHVTFNNQSHTQINYFNNILKQIFNDLRIDLKYFCMQVWFVLIISISVCLTSAPRVERVDESCEVSWETLPPMKGDPVIYCLQSMQGNSEFKQVPTPHYISCMYAFQQKTAHQTTKTSILTSMKHLN